MPGTPMDWLLGRVECLGATYTGGGLQRVAVWLWCDRCPLTEFENPFALALRALENMASAVSRSGANAAPSTAAFAVVFADT